MRALLALVPLAATLALGCASPAWKPVPMTVLPAMPAYEPPPQTAPVARKRSPKPPEPRASAMSGELPPELGPIGRVELCKERACSLGAIVPASMLAEKKAAGGTAPGAPIAVWTTRFASAGQTLSTPRDARVDVYGVVLRGEVKIRGVEQATSIVQPTWRAFRASGGGLAIRATKPDTLVMLAVATDGAPVLEVAVQSEKNVVWRERPKPIETRDLSASPDLAWMGGAFHARLGFEDGRASLEVLLGSRDAPVKPHTHDGSWEALAVARGGGSFSSTEGDAAGAHAVRDGDVVLVPKGVRHAWTPAGESPLVAIQLYAPPGPEQRFKELGHAR